MPMPRQIKLPSPTYRRRPGLGYESLAVNWPKALIPPIALILLFLFTLMTPVSGGAQMPMPMNPVPPEHNRARLPEAATARIIEVSGRSEVQAAPDLATLEIAIETHVASADQAAGLNGALAAKVSEALKSKLAD